MTIGASVDRGIGVVEQETTSARPTELVGPGSLAGYVDAHGVRLLRTAYLLTGDRSEAEDLLQETLARLVTAWPRIHDGGAVDAYVRRAMVNLRTSRWRRRRLQVEPVAEPPETAAAQQVSFPDERAALWLAVGRLPARMRAAVVLRFYEDLSEAETAAALGCSIGNVKSQTSRALAKLRIDPATLEARTEVTR